MLVVICQKSLVLEDISSLSPFLSSFLNFFISKIVLHLARGKNVWSLSLFFGNIFASFKASLSTDHISKLQAFPPKECQLATSITKAQVMTQTPTLSLNRSCTQSIKLQHLSFLRRRQLMQLSQGCRKSGVLSSCRVSD